MDKLRHPSGSFHPRNRAALDRAGETVFSRPEALVVGHPGGVM